MELFNTQSVEWIQSILGTEWYPVFRVITELGSEEAFIIFIALYYWLIHPWIGRQLGILMGISFGLNLLIKDITDLPRPFEVNPNLELGSSAETAMGESFPSAHAQGSSTFLFYLAGRYSQRWLWIFSIILVVLISFSRIYLGVHFPIDVVVGLLLGIAFVCLGLFRNFPARQSLIINAILVAVTFLVAFLIPAIAETLGVIVGFFLTRPSFTPPKTWKGRLLLGGGGLVIVILFHIGASFLFRQFGIITAMRYWRYLALTLLATEACPRLLNRERE